VIRTLEEFNNGDQDEIWQEKPSIQKYELMNPANIRLWYL
jgi:hypothetical protein